jgi:hypothetical protein
LPAAPFAALFDLDDRRLASLNIRRVTADSDFGYPCRVSLEEAAAGEEMLLLSFEHQAAASPYRASGPIFVRRGAAQGVLAPGVVPLSVERRLISIRVYDRDHMMSSADVVDGVRVAGRLEALFADPNTSYVHLHNAKRGCFACRVVTASALPG